MTSIRDHARASFASHPEPTGELLTGMDRVLGPSVREQKQIRDRIAASEPVPDAEMAAYLAQQSGRGAA